MGNLYDSTTTPSVSENKRFLTNLLLHPPGLYPTQVDASLQPLIDCAGYGLFLCAVSYGAVFPQTMRELSRQQEITCATILEAIHHGISDDYIYYTSETENQLIALFIRRDYHRLSTLEFGAMLSKLLTPAIDNLTRIQCIPLHLIWGTQSKISKLNQSYVLLKNAVIYLDFMQQSSDSLMQLEEITPKEHIELWNYTEENKVSFVDAFLHNDLQGAVSLVNQMIDTIATWVPLSKDALLSDVQHYFDAVLNRLSNQFGPEVIENVPLTTAIFEAENISQMRQELSEIVETLFINVRKNASSDTFNRMLAVRGYIQEHIREVSLTAGSIAEQFCMSPQLLSIQFKQCFAKTPIQFVEKQRVAMIQEYLLHTDLTIEKICKEVGIGTVSTLHRIFGKHTGQTPGAYRREMRISRNET